MQSLSLDIYCIAIGGTGMAPLACLLKDLGHRVRGVDGPLYPPMSTLLEEAGIEPIVGYQTANLEEGPRPDLVVVGNAVPRHNPEAETTERLGLPRASMPEMLSRFLLADRRPLVVAGTHGKTTTSSLATWVYRQSGSDPGFLIGGIPINLERSFHLGSSERFIIEGDEYNASYFDRGPKFLHYRPDALILTSVEHDHVDLYPNPESLLDAYRSLMRLLPKDGVLAACGDSAEVREVASHARCRVIFYGLMSDNDVHPTSEVEYGPTGSRFTVRDHEFGEVEISLQIPGEHNVSNSLAVWATARHDGLAATSVAAALGSFRGVKRRLEVLGTEAGVTVIDDFAHHPTAVEKSLDGLRRAYPGRRLLALFEPRSLTAGRAFLYEAYRRAFALADGVIIAPIFHHGRIEEDQRLDLGHLLDELQRAGVVARSCASIDEVFDAALREVRAGDVLVTMSSGSFDRMPHRMLRALVERSESA